MLNRVLGVALVATVVLLECAHQIADFSTPTRVTTIQSTNDDPLYTAVQEKKTFSPFVWLFSNDQPGKLTQSLGTNNETSLQSSPKVQARMDFAVLGHPKTATTSTLSWLSGHDEIAMYPHELHTLQKGDAAAHARVFEQLPAHKKRGYKNPTDIYNKNAVAAIGKYWPETKLIVGLRHPVLWFQSFYNFRVRKGVPMFPPEKLLGRCFSGTKGVCTDAAMFHVHLNHLGKTNRSTVREQNLLKAPAYKVFDELEAMSNPLFLYEINQLHDKNVSRMTQYRTDLQHYLGVHEPLSRVVGSTSSLKNKTSVFNICDEPYLALREELMRHARAASLWIREYLLSSRDVTVSSPEYFTELVASWMLDPCEVIDQQ